MKKILPFLAAAVFAPAAFAAPKPVVKYEVVEKFETAPTLDEARQAITIFEESQEKNRSLLGKKLYLQLPHWEEKTRGRIENFSCFLGENKTPNSRYPAWEKIFNPDFKWHVVSKNFQSAEIEKLKILEAAGYVTVEEGIYNVVCPPLDSKHLAPDRKDFFNPRAMISSYFHQAPAYRYAFTDKALKEFFDGDFMWNVVDRPEDGVEFYDADKIMYIIPEERKTGKHPKSVLKRDILFFPLGTIGIAKIENI